MVKTALDNFKKPPCAELLGWRLLDARPEDGWIKLGFDSIERILAEDGQAGDFCQGDEPSLADVCLVPQFFNAQRYPSFDLAPYPTIRRIAGNCLKLDAFQRALPENQPDAE